MKKFFYVLGIVLFSVCLFASCQSSILSKVKKNLSEESQIVFSGKNENFYVTYTSGKREEPYQVDGISKKKVDFGVVSITFYHPLKEMTTEIMVSIDSNQTNHLAEKNPITNSFMLDTQKKVLPNSKITITVKDQQIELTCKSDTFVVDYTKAIENGTNYLYDNIESILSKKGNFEVFLKLATAPNNYDDVFVWYFFLKSDIGISAVAMISTTQEGVFSIL